MSNIKWLAFFPLPLEDVQEVSKFTRSYCLKGVAARRRYAGGFGTFKQHQVRKRRLCALDLRGEHGFLANVEVDEERGIRQNLYEAVQATKCLVCLVK
jgi:hypothetical protein